MATVKKIVFVNVNGFSVPVTTMVNVPDAIDFGAATNKMTWAEISALGQQTMTARKLRALADGRAKLAKNRENARIGRAANEAAAKALATGVDVTTPIGDRMVTARIVGDGVVSVSVR